MNDDVVISRHLSTALHLEDLDDHGIHEWSISEISDGVLHEFRNHVTLLLAGMTEIRATLPRTASADLAETLDEMEASLQVLTALAVSVDAALRPGEQLISDLLDVLHRAVSMVNASLKARSSITIETRPAAVKNRGGAVECAVALLIAHLVRAADAKRNGSSTPTRVKLAVFPDRGALALEITTDSPSRPAPSWRSMMATHLLGRLGCRVDLHPERTGYVARFQ